MTTISRRNLLLAGPFIILLPIIAKYGGDLREERGKPTPKHTPKSIPTSVPIEVTSTVTSISTPTDIPILTSTPTATAIPTPIVVPVGGACLPLMFHLSG